MTQFDFYTCEGGLARLDASSLETVVLQPEDGGWYPCEPEWLMGPISEQYAQRLAGSHSLTAPRRATFWRGSAAPFQFYTDEGQLGRRDTATGEQAILQPGGTWYPWPSWRVSPISDQRALRLAEGHSLTAPSRKPYTPEQIAEFKRTGDPTALADRAEGDQR